MDGLPWAPDRLPLISNLADPLLPPRLPDDVTAGWMTPPTNHGGWADSQWNSGNTDFFSLPIGAGPDDILAGYDELGNPIYQTITGQRYQLNAAPKKEGSVVRALAAQAASQPVTDSIGAVAKALAQGAWDTFSLPGRAAAGEPVTYGDAAGFVADYGAMGALGAAPEGALRMGAIRSADDLPRAQADEIMDLLRSGRGDEVTDAMFAAADQDYLSSIYDLPMDEASRLDRAFNQGYHYVRRSQSEADPFNDVPWAMFVEHQGDPVGKLEQLSSYGPGQWMGRTDLSGIDAGKALVRAARDSQVTSLEGVTGAEIARRAMPENIVDGAGLWDDMNPARWMSEELATSGINSIGTPDGMVAFIADDAVLPPSGIRSFGARFDPRLSHLRNFSAGLGGLGFGLYAMQPTEADAAEIQSYLDGQS